MILFRLEKMCVYLYSTALQISNICMKYAYVLVAAGVLV